MIKAIIFDCFGVLTSDSWKEFCASLPEGPGLEKAHELNHAYDAGFITLREFAEGVHQATGKTPMQVEQLLDNEVSKNTALLEYISELKQNFKIGLLSNVGTNWIRDRFLTQSEQALFDDMVLSYEAGTTKPDPRIFELACSRLQIEPSAAVMIDDIERYCEAARDVGMKAVVYVDLQQLKQDLEPILYFE